MLGGSYLGHTSSPGQGSSPFYLQDSFTICPRTSHIMMSENSCMCC